MTLSPLQSHRACCSVHFACSPGRPRSEVTDSPRLAPRRGPLATAPSRDGVLPMGSLWKGLLPTRDRLSAELEHQAPMWGGLKSSQSLGPPHQLQLAIIVSEGGGQGWGEMNRGLPESQDGDEEGGTQWPASS